MINDKIKPNGELNIVLRDKFGNIKEQRTVPNAITTLGKSLIAQRIMVTTTAVAPTHMALGTGSGTVGGTQQTLFTEAASTRVNGALSSTMGTGADVNKITYSNTFAGGVGTAALTEAGIFTAQSGGILLCHTTFNAVNKDANDTLTINWTITIS